MHQAQLIGLDKLELEKSLGLRSLGLKKLGLGKLGLEKAWAWLEKLENFSIGVILTI